MHLPVIDLQEKCNLDSGKWSAILQQDKGILTWGKCLPNMNKFCDSFGFLKQKRSVFMARSFER